MSRFSHWFRVKATRAAAAGTAAALGLLVADLAAAQGDQALEVDVAECVEIESPAERFRCYENRVDSALREQSSSGGQAASPPPVGAPASSSAGAPASSSAGAPASPPVSAPAGRASPSGSRREPASELALERDIAVGEPAAVPDNFGFARADEREEEEEEEEEGERLRDEVFSTVVALRETVPNSYLITLENGQVWRQTVPKQYPLRPGYEVRVYLSRFGYRLAATERNGFIQVERVR